MARLSVGDRVMDASGAREGKIIDIEGTTAYVLQPNGVEIEFALDKLKPYEAPKSAAAAPSGDHTLTGPQRVLLRSVPAEILSAVAKSYDKGDGTPRAAFAELTDKKKLETIRIYLPSLPRQVLASHLKLVVAFRDLGK